MDTRIFVRFLAISTCLLACAALPALAQKTDSGFLKARVNPGRAGVFVDGKYVGPAANFGMTRTYALSAGEHEVTLNEPRYESVTTKVKIEAGKTAKISETLKPLAPAKPPFGMLKTKSDNKFDAVFVNGKYMGHVDEFDNPTQALLLNPGEYTVRIVSPGGDQRQEEKVNIQVNQTVIVRAGAKPGK